MAQTIIHPYGTLEVVDAPPTLLQRLRAVMPLGLMQLSGRTDGATFGIVEQCGNKVLHGVRYPRWKGRPKCSFDELVQFDTRWALLSASRYMREGFTGAIIPAKYLRSCSRHSVETGMACFAFPTKEDSERPYHRGEKQPAEDLEPGMIRMAQACVWEMHKARAEAGLTGYKKFSPSVHPLRDFGQLRLDFMVLGRDLLCLKRIIDPADRFWEYLCQSPISGQIIHLPSTVVKIESHQLAEATGKADVHGVPEAGLQAV